MFVRMDTWMICDTIDQQEHIQAQRYIQGCGDSKNLYNRQLDRPKELRWGFEESLQGHVDRGYQRRDDIIESKWSMWSGSSTWMLLRPAEQACFQNKYRCKWKCGAIQDKTCGIWKRAAIWTLLDTEGSTQSWILVLWKSYWCFCVDGTAHHVMVMSRTLMSR